MLDAWIIMFCVFFPFYIKNSFFFFILYDKKDSFKSYSFIKITLRSTMVLETTFRALSPFWAVAVSLISMIRFSFWLLAPDLGPVVDQFSPVLFKLILISDPQLNSSHKVDGSISNNSSLSQVTSYLVSNNSYSIPILAQKFVEYWVRVVLFALACRFFNTIESILNFFCQCKNFVTSQKIIHNQIA